MEGFGFTRKIKFMIKKKRGNIENTQMTEEFTTARQNYNEYKVALTQLTNAVESVVQPNHKYREGPKGGEEKPEAHLAMEALAGQFQSYVGLVEDTMKEQSKLAKAESTLSRAVDAIKQHEQEMTDVIQPLRDFHNHFKDQFEPKMNEFDEAKNAMDLAKYEVQNSKNTMEIEKKAVTYKQAVENFDGYCSQAIKELETLSRIKDGHGQQLMTIWSTHKAYHHRMSKVLKKIK